MAKRLVERYRRGFFGWIFLLLFWGWNLLMIWALITGVSGTSTEMAALTTETERNAYATGAGLGIVFVLMIWAVGSVVFGLLAYFTRGRKEIIECDT